MTMLIGQIEATAAQALGEFAGLNLVVGDSRTVHAATVVSWAGDAEAPAPACHVGVNGWNPRSHITSTVEPVSCRRPGCRDTGIVIAATAQLALWGPDEALDAA